MTVRALKPCVCVCGLWSVVCSTKPPLDPLPADRANSGVVDISPHARVWQAFMTAHCGARVAAALHMLSSAQVNEATDRDILSPSRVHKSTVDALQTLCRLQTEFGVIIDVKTLSSRRACEALLPAVVRPFVESSHARAQARSAAVGAPSLSSLFSFDDSSSGSSSGPSSAAQATAAATMDDDIALARVFRFSELLGIDRTLVRGVLAKECAHVGDVMGSLDWCRDLSVNTVVAAGAGGAGVDGKQARPRKAVVGSDAVGARALKEASAAITSFAATHPDVFHVRSHTATKAAKCRARSHHYAELLLRQALCTCTPTELADTLSLWQSTDLVALVLAKSEVGDYGRLWEVADGEYDDLSTLSLVDSAAEGGDADVLTAVVARPVTPYTCWFRETTAVMKTSKAMTLATKCASAHHVLRQHMDVLPVGDGGPPGSSGSASIAPLVKYVLASSAVGPGQGTPSWGAGSKAGSARAAAVSGKTASPLVQLGSARDALVAFLEESGCLQLAVHAILGSVSVSLQENDVKAEESVCVQLWSKVIIVVQQE